MAQEGAPAQLEMAALREAVQERVEEQEGGMVMEVARAEGAREQASARARVCMVKIR